MWQIIARRTATAVLGILTYLLGKPMPLPLLESDDKWNDSTSISTTTSTSPATFRATSQSSLWTERITTGQDSAFAEQPALTFLLDLIRIVPAEYVLFFCLLGLLFVVQLIGCGLCLCCVGCWCTMRAGAKFILKIIVRPVSTAVSPPVSPSRVPLAPPAQTPLSDLAQSVYPAVAANTPTPDAVPSHRRPRSTRNVAHQE